nr:four helix bundle protein [uncultured Flavobacterium sp.]
MRCSVLSHQILHKVRIERINISVLFEYLFKHSFELQTQLFIACQNDYLSKEKTKEIENKIIEFQKMTTGFISKLDDNLSS